MRKSNSYNMCACGYGKRTYFYIAALAVFLVVSLLPDLAYAQASDAGALDTIQTNFKTAILPMLGTVKGFAERIFFAIVLIDIFWTGFKLAFEGSTLNQFSAEFMRRIIVIGIFLWLIRSGDFSAWIIDSVQQMANESLSAGASPSSSSSLKAITPSNLVSYGLELAGRIGFTVKLFSPGASLIVAAAAVLVCICFALIAAQMLQVLIEAYIGILVGTLMLGFGGMRATSDFAMKFLFYLISVGLKLFSIMLLAGIGYLAIKNFTDAPGYKFDNFNGAFTVLAMCIVLFALVRSVPEIVQGVVNGVAAGNSMGIAAAAQQTASTGVRAGMAVATGGKSLVAGGAMGAASSAASAGGAQASGGAKLAQALKFAAVYSTAPGLAAAGAVKGGKNLNQALNKAAAKK